MLLGVFFQGLPPGLCRAATPLKSHEKFIVRGFGGGGAWAGQEGGSLFLPPSAPPLPKNPVSKALKRPRYCIGACNCNGFQKVILKHFGTLAAAHLPRRDSPPSVVRFLRPSPVFFVLGLGDGGAGECCDAGDESEIVAGGDACDEAERVELEEVLFGHVSSIFNPP